MNDKKAAPTPTGETPETDAQYTATARIARTPALIAFMKLAKKLERERNAALAKLKDQS